jgi:hypothetical protein
MLEPNVLNKIGKVAALYQIGNDVSAAQASNTVVDKIATGIERAKEILETPIPEPTSTGTETSTSTAAFGGSPLAGIISPSNVEAASASAAAADEQQILT